MEDIILLGIGGHAHSVVDSIEQSELYRIVGFLDREEKQGVEYKTYKVLGTDRMLESYYKSGIRNAFVTVGYLGEGNVREQLYNTLKRIGYHLPNIIDNTAILANNIRIGEGNFIGKRTIVNANAVIGDMCIINTGSIVEHDCRVGDMVHIAVGAVLCGHVSVGSKSFIGANSVIRQEIVIGKNAIIGAGTVITKNVKDNIKKYGKREQILEE